jgi:hypothetical protein
MHRLPRHPDRGRCLGHRPAILDHREHCLIALLRQLNSLIRERQGSTGTDVNHQPELRQASTGTSISTIKRSNTKLGAGDETRTRNLLFTRQLRYRLRHASNAGKAYQDQKSPGPPTNAVP